MSYPMESLTEVDAEYRRLHDAHQDHEHRLQALAGKPQVRVIHGHGTGALRRGLAQFFSTHPLVERIHAEADERGGAAVTVVELKE